MSALSEFLLSACAGALIFAVIAFVLPEKGAGRTARLVASVFVLTVILKSGISAVISVSEVKTEIYEQSDEYDRNKYISKLSAEAIKRVIEEKLLFAGCSYSETEVSVVYTEDGFSDLKVTVTVDSEEDRMIAESVSRALETEFEIRVE